MKAIQPLFTLVETLGLTANLGTHLFHLMKNTGHNFTGRHDEVVATILEWWDTHERGDLKSGVWRGRAMDLRGKM